jgi:predicted MFS family arabinose efflux permease
MHPFESKANHDSSAPAFAVTPSIALLFAVASGLSVSSIYYAQPLLDALAVEFHIAHSSIGLLITITQTCYALGLFLLVPLGDLLDRRKLIFAQMLASALALTMVGFSPTPAVLYAGLSLVGFLAVVTQALVAFAATMSAPKQRGRIVGIVTSGIVIGILLARTFAGIVTDLAGWRFVYLVSAVFTLIMSCTLLLILPRQDHQAESLSYVQLLRSVFALFLQERILRVRAMLALLIFAVFSILWTSLVLPLSAPPLSLSHTAIGAFGLAGVTGALAAVRAGRYADRGLGQRTTGTALALLLASWVPLGYTEHSLVALVIGIVLLDMAVQAVHVTNQSMILVVRPEARSRLTAAYMIFYSIGSATGSIASTYTYTHGGWSGVCLLGAAVSGIALLFWAATKKEAHP